MKKSVKSMYCEFYSLSKEEFCEKYSYNEYSRLSIAYYVMSIQYQYGITISRDWLSNYIHIGTTYSLVFISETKKKLREVYGDIATTHNQVSYHEVVLRLLMDGKKNEALAIFGKIKVEAIIELIDSYNECLKNRKSIKQLLYNGKFSHIKTHAIIDYYESLIKH